MSFGSAFGAIVSLKNNRRSKSGRTGKYIAGNDPVFGVKSHRTPSAEELKEIKRRLQAENKIRQNKIFGISAVFLLILLALFGYFMF